jgi:hypothetical protein
VTGSRICDPRQLWALTRIDPGGGFPGRSLTAAFKRSGGDLLARASTYPRPALRNQGTRGGRASSNSTMAASDVTDISGRLPQRVRSSFRWRSRSGESRLTQSASECTLTRSDLQSMAWACPFGAARAPRAGARRSGGSSSPLRCSRRHSTGVALRPQSTQCPTSGRHSLAKDFLFVGWTKGKPWFLEANEGSRPLLIDCCPIVVTALRP